MPTVLREKGYRFFFFSFDWREPIHIHIEKSDSYAKFWLNPISLARSKGFKSFELNEIYSIIESNRKLFEEKWHEHFSDKG
jgi:hypothetical protein